MAFRGTFDYTLDAKNRLTVPSKFRAVLGQSAVLAKMPVPCISVSTPAAYDERLKDALEGYHSFSPEAAQIKRYFSGNAHDVELDTAGRVMLPPFLIESAGLGKEVVVIGSDDSFEIWDPATWAEHNAGLDQAIADIQRSLGGSARETGA